MIEIVSIFILGILIGSFLNVVIHRVPLEENIAFPPSHCPKCKEKLFWWHNIPIISYLLLRAKCHFCKESISARYPMVEFVSGLLFVALYLKVGLQWELLFIYASFAALLALSMIDFDYMAVPDSINFAALLFALINPDFLNSLKYAAIAALGLFIIGFISSKLAKKDALGSADIIVAGTMGALLGFPLFFVALFLSALLAMIPSLVYREKGVPFVPFLALATFIVYIFDDFCFLLLEEILHV
jgi:leader peptidase (prepilin peptidase)/N-methyltransferase